MLLLLFLYHIIFFQLLKNNQDKNSADIINLVSQRIETTNAQVQSSTQNIIKSQNENTCLLLKSENESTSQLLMSQNDLKSKLVETQKELQKNTDSEFINVSETKVIEKGILLYRI